MRNTGTEQPFDKVVWLAGYLLAHQAGITAEGEAAVPRALVVTRDQPDDAQLLVFEAASYQEAVAQGRSLLADQKDGLRCWAFAYDAGRLSGGLTDGDALVVEANVEDGDRPLSFLQRYQPKSDSAPFRLIGGVEMAGAWSRPAADGAREPAAWDSLLREGIQSHPLAGEAWTLYL
ncbi:MAG TPA: hypothetical protein VEL74_12485 [Thermoanaerobaculia bacterium]|nr:hypothetical protein [Thermoanaerobaculia bacterium]